MITSYYCVLWRWTTNNTTANIILWQWFIYSQLTFSFCLSLLLLLQLAVGTQFATLPSSPSRHQLNLSTKQTTAGGSNSSTNNSTNNSTVVAVSNIWAGTNVKSPKLISIAIVKVKHITGIINLTQCIVVLFFEACENKIKIKITMLDFSAASIILLCLYH